VVKKHGGRPAFYDHSYSNNGTSVVRCLVNGGVGKLHWHSYGNNTLYYGDQRLYKTLCGKLRAQQAWGSDIRKFKNKDVCQACEKALKELRRKEKEYYDKHFDEDGEHIPEPTPKERATQVRAKALARPKKPWQPKNKQRSFRLIKKNLKRAQKVIDELKLLRQLDSND